MNMLGRGACAAIVLAAITLTGACSSSGGGGGGGGGTSADWTGCYHATAVTFEDIQVINSLNQENNAILRDSSDGSCTGAPTAVTLISLVTPNQALADSVCENTYGKTGGGFPVGPQGYARSDGVHLTDSMYWCF